MKTLKDEVAKRYVGGERIADLAEECGVCKATIRRWLHGMGVKVRNGRQWGWHWPGKSLHSDERGYLRTYDREGKRQRVHRICWEAHYGPIPEGHVVHHADEDRQNNAIENLVCMTHGEHSRLHNLRRAKHE